jgi:hypothetical protein
MSEPFLARREDYIEMLRGPVADPAISMLLRREQLAVLKIQQIDQQIQQLEQTIEMLNTQRELLAKEYRIG